MRDIRSVFVFLVKLLARLLANDIDSKDILELMSVELDVEI